MVKILSSGGLGEETACVGQSVVDLETRGRRVARLKGGIISRFPFLPFHSLLRISADWPYILAPHACTTFYVLSACNRVFYLATFELRQGDIMANIGVLRNFLQAMLVGPHTVFRTTSTASSFLYHRAL